MKILHYSLGFPPYRSGGLTKYCVDLMEEQTELGNSVCLLWPGKMNIINKDVKIKQNKNYKSIESYEIINSLPVPLLNGINVPDEYMKKCNEDVYAKFLEQLKPDVIHLHTLMGLHKEFLVVANRKNIKVVYTSHDYFGLCPKVNLFNSENVICDGINNEKCSQCSKYAFGHMKMYILQSKTYRYFKGTKLFKFIKPKVNIYESRNDDTSKTKANILDYTKLKEYYREMYKKIDEFYFNSEIAYNVYNSNKIKMKRYFIEPITHKNVIDKRKKKEYNSSKDVHIGYIAAPSYTKGFYTIVKAFDKLYRDNYKFKLEIYYNIKGEYPSYIHINSPYTYSNITEVLDQIDVLVVPSNWNETFGYGVIEALSHGVPVICSKNVGASFLLKNRDYGYVYETEEELENIFKELFISKQKLIEWNDNIIKANDLNFDMKSHTKKILQLYKG